MDSKPKRKSPDFTFLFGILVSVIGLFSLMGLTSIDMSVNRIIGPEYDSISNVEQMEYLVYNQNLLITHYLLDPDDFPPSKTFQEQTKSFNDLYNIEYDHADTLEAIDYTYHIITKYTALVDMFSKLLQYTNAESPRMDEAVNYYQDQIIPQVSSIHSALQIYKDYKEKQMEAQKVMADNMVKTSFTVLFIFCVISCFICYYLSKRILQRNLTPVYSVLEEYQKLEKTKSDFVSTISHEFKTPLTSIVMGTDLLRNEDIGSLNQDQSEIVDTLAEDSFRLTCLVNNLLELSKIESSNTVYAFEEKNIEEIISNAVEPFVSIAEKSGISLTFEPILPLPKAVVDGSKITWVMNNLITNALKYTDEGDSITVKAFLDENGFITVSVKDTGFGIPAEYTEKIFEKYFQVKDSDIELGGTGLGLAISKEIITAHSGSIWCDSQLKQGSTFTFTLPALENNNGTNNNRLEKKGRDEQNEESINH